MKPASKRRKVSPNPATYSRTLQYLTQTAFSSGGGRVPPRKGEKLRALVMGKAIARLCARSPLLLVPALAAKKVYAQNISVLFFALIGQIPRIALSTGLGSGPKDFHRQGMVQLTIVLSANCTPSIKKEKVAP